MDQLPRLGKRELICLLLFTCNYVVSVWGGFLFLWVLGLVYVFLLWHYLSLPYNYYFYFVPVLFLTLLKLSAFYQLHDSQVCTVQLLKAYRIKFKKFAAHAHNDALINETFLPT